MSKQDVRSKEGLTNALRRGKGVVQLQLTFRQESPGAVRHLPGLMGGRKPKIRLLSDVSMATLHEIAIGGWGTHSRTFTIETLPNFDPGSFLHLLNGALEELLELKGADKVAVEEEKAVA